MAKCRHTRWLRLTKKDQGFALEVSDRAQALLDSLPRPEKQTPSIIVLVGNHSKSRLLNKLEIGITGPRGKRGHGEIHMFLTPSSAHVDCPVLIADGDIPPQNRLGRPWKPQLCHEVSIRPLMNPIQGKVAEIADHVYHRLVLPFADVVCLFATDLGGLEQTAHHVAQWLEKGQLSTIEALSWLVIVVDDGVEAEVLATFNGLIRCKTSIDLLDRFRGIRLISLTKPNKRRRSCRGNTWDYLNGELLKISQLIRQNRLERSCLFAARHLAGFLQHAAIRATETLCEPFDFIRTSRLKNPVAPDLEIHLARFLRHFESLDALKSFALPMIASSFILDHYPPGMHPFRPHDIFITLYKSVCSTVCKSAVLTHKGSNTFILPSAFTQLVEEELQKQFGQYLVHNSSRDLHLQVIFRFKQQWVDLRSEDTCFCCIRRRPQFGLPCGHSLCENCVRVFGRKSMTDPWAFHIDTCFLCNAETVGIQIKVKPDTASVRVLSIDGGGTRGRVPLEFVRVLQDRLGLPYPIQYNFDVVYGTSSGAIIASALCVNGWSVEDCISSFEDLARLAFKPRPSYWIPFLSSIYEFAISLIVDSRYPAKNLEAALQTVFGSTRSLIDCSKASETGTMLGMPVTTIRDVSACVFTNYNGVGKREARSDYYVPQLEGATRRIPLWEVLRCATAAPYYFKPRHIDGLGTFQDGGLMYNNPVSIALQEVAALFPDTPEPSLVVSLGTGSARVERPDTSRSRPLWRDSFLLRVFRAFWQYGSSNRAWQQLLSHQKVGKTGEFFRFDVEFEGPEPSLDDVLVMNEIGDIARETILDSPALDRLVLRIRAELFIFELDPLCPFQLVSGMYECVGKITCRLQFKTPEFESFMAQLGQSSATFLVGESVLPGSFHDRYAKLQDRSFAQEVKFRTPSRLEPITISLREQDTPYPITGAPFTLQWLLEAQNLEARFGTVDHRKRKWPIEKEEEPRQKRVRRR